MPGITSQGFYDPYQNMNYQGNNGFDLLKLTQANPLLTLGSQLGGNILQQLGGLGKSWDEKMRERVANWLEQNKNRPAVTEGQIRSFQPLLEQSITPYLNKIGQNASRAGVLQGQGQGEILRAGQSELAQALAQLRQMAIQMNANQPFKYAQAIGGLSYGK